jgi:putative membrane protein
MMGYWDNWHFGMGFGWIFAVLFWVVILIGIAALVWWLFPKRGGLGSQDRPLDILKRRYARGELTREEYEQMRRDIES